MGEMVLPVSGTASASEAATSLSEMPKVSMINLRGPAADTAFQADVAAIIGMPLALSPNRFTARKDRQCIWQGPDEWLVVTVPGDGTHLAKELDEALAGYHHAVTDVSGNRLALRLAGSHAIDLLSMGCGLDFADHVFPTGACAQTVFAKLPITILRVDDAPSFEIHVRRSFVHFLKEWTAHAAKSLR